MAKPNPGHVSSCLMSWELWLYQNTYYRNTTWALLCVACFVMKSWREVNFTVVETHFQNLCYYFCANDFSRPPGIIKALNNYFQKSLVAFSCALLGSLVLLLFILVFDSIYIQ